jgi:hypothetical protein
MPLAMEAERVALEEPVLVTLALLSQGLRMTAMRAVQLMLGPRGWCLEQGLVRNGLGCQLSV